MYKTNPTCIIYLIWIALVAVLGVADLQVITKDILDLVKMPSKDLAPGITPAGAVITKGIGSPRFVFNLPV